MSKLKDLLQPHETGSSKLTVRSFLADQNDEHDPENPIPPQNYALIEGNREELMFLADLIKAYLDSDYGCTLDIHPSGAGSAHFSESSNLGIFIHRLPCDLHADNVVR